MKIFLSHSSKDHGIANKVYEKLEGGFDAFYSKQHMSYGDSVDDEIFDQLDSCEGVVFLLSANFFKTGSYALKELAFVEEKWPKPERRVLPVLLPGMTLENVKEKSEYLYNIQMLELKDEDSIETVLIEARKMWPIVIANYSDKQDQLQSDNPYRALKHFGPNHAQYFFGRKGFVDSIEREVFENKESIVIILGSSGLGKSSVVLAGFVPRLFKKKDSKWRFTYFNFADNAKNPFDELASALLPFCDDTEYDKLSDGGNKKKKRDELSKELCSDENKLGEILNDIKRSNNLLIIADQFEGLFTCQNKQLQISFLKMLKAGIDASKEPAEHSGNRLILVVTLRETGRDTETALFAESIGKKLHNLGSVSADKDTLDHIIKSPIDGKVTIDNDVVNDIKKAFVENNEIKSLPLLQYTLFQLWEKKQINGQNNGHVIDYNAISKFRGTSGKIDLFRVLNKTADDEFDKWTTCPPVSEETFKRLFLNLINSSNGSSPQARAKEDLPDSWELAENLATSGLIRTFKKDGTHYAEIVHEALIEHWDKLKKWVEIAEKEAQVKNNLLNKANDWKKNNPRNYIYSIFYSLFREDYSLLRSDELDKALTYEKNSSSSLSDVEKEFLKVSERHNKIVQYRPYAACLTVIIIVFLFLWGNFAKLEGEKEQLRIDTSNRLSLGEKYFFTQVTQEDSSKREGIWHFKDKKYDLAITSFEQHLSRIPDDPEARIYLNNARAKDSFTKPPMIAVIAPIQQNVTLAKEILRGVAHAQNDVNEKWWNCIKIQKRNECGKNYPFQVMIGSDDNNPEVARRIANYMVEGITGQGRIIAVVGHNASNVTKSVIPIYQNHLVMISPTSSTLNAEDIRKKVKQKKNNFTYLIAYPNKDLTPNLAEMLKSSKDNPKRKLLYCRDPNIEKSRLEEGFRNVITSAKTECIFKGFKVDNVFKVAKEEMVTDILLAPHASTITDSIFVVRKNARDEKKFNLYGTATLYSREVLEANEPGFLGMTLAIGWHPRWKSDDKDIENKISEFNEYANKMWGYTEETRIEQSEINITWRTASAYDATKLISEGLNQIHLANKELSPSVLQRTISSSLPFKGVTGDIEFDENGIRSGEPPSILVRVEKNGENYKFNLLGDAEIRQSDCSTDYREKEKLLTYETPIHD